MKKILFSAVILALAAGAIMAKPKDPVIMTVNGRPVLKSEFEYLYNKNVGQQLEHQSLDEYVDLFVNYKLKVADALANKYDTTPEFISELAMYQNDLSAPYMVDTDAENRQLDKMYDHYKNMKKVSHIMFADPSKGQYSMNFIDSIRNELVAGRADWNETAAKYSIDRPTSADGGSMGWLLPGRFPVAFEDMAYATEVGTISQPVNSGFGIHLIRVDGERENPGEVKARHILKLTARKSLQEALKVKEQIDSIYAVLMQGADFADVARRESEDPGSNASGGDLDWFGAGVMVAPFDSVSFAIPEGVISQPVQTSYGWHIIEVMGRRPAKTRLEMDDQLKEAFSNGERGAIARREYIDKLMTKYNSHLVEAGLDEVEAIVNANPGGLTQELREQLSSSPIVIAEVGGNAVTLAEVMPAANFRGELNGKVVREGVVVAAEKKLKDDTMVLFRQALKESNENYRNLVNEYADGILLFNISQDKIWQKPASNPEGLEAYFQTNRDKYKWDEPRYKAVIIFTTADSIETQIKDYVSGLDKSKVNPATLGKELRDKFGKNVRAERVIAKKGENPITDYLAFGGPKPDQSNAWAYYFAFMDEIIDQPVHADDVKGKVTADYQNYLEQEWIKELKKKYPVTIDKKVLKTVKEFPAK